MLCPLCGSDAVLVHAGLAGYQAPARFDVYDCGLCGAEFSWPMSGGEAIYERIYRSIKSIPGYSRYLSYAENVAKQASPLDYLANKEESYWATAVTLRALRERSGRQLKVLDVGSGMGYLTYALHRDGFDVKGVDVSRKAVETAESRFGRLFVCSSLEDLLHEGPGFDVVILNQLVEHVVDVRSLLENAVKVASPSGRILVTTPNRSFSRNGAVWETDLPPVHYWWFSERSLEYISGHLGCDLELFDFSGFYSAHYVRENRAIFPSANARRHFLDSNGEPCIKLQPPPMDWWLERLAEKVGGAGGYRTVRESLTGERRISGKRGRVSCAILTKGVGK
ncbi:MAG TPA: hypothetical protein DCW72_02835 [Elusimicrobia bacterium]|nr:hypothetical protein [Elusimicrobiota bacterium]HAU89188.1 hypothetical protein [Elusimicrobiota bacterium]